MSGLLQHARLARLLVALFALLAIFSTPTTASHLSPPNPVVPARPSAPGELPWKVFLPLVAGWQFSPGYDVNVGLTGFEPTTAVLNPLNPHNVAVARGGRLALSTDFGRTFPTTVGFAVPATLGGLGYGGCGDSTLAFDAQGRLFWNYLVCNNTDVSLVVMQVNPLTGATGAAIDVTPGNFTGDDKGWIAADANPASPFANNLYLVWSRIGTGVQFSRSINSNGTWSAAQTISAGGEGFVWPSHVAVAQNGDVYVSYHGDTCGSATASMFVLRDSSGGVNLAGGIAVQKTSFSSAVTCNVQASPPSASQIPRVHSWMQGALGPYVLPDPVRPGNVYVVANDDPNNDFTSGDPGDIVLARSTNYGNSWTVQTISHAPAGTLQAFPIGAIDQNGRIAVFWYDTRRGLNNNGPDGVADTADDYFNMDVYATVSPDGGQTWSNDFRINDAVFDPDLGAPCRFGPQADCGGGGTARTLRIGEYNGIAAANGVGYAAWTGNTATGQQTVFDVFSILGAFEDRLEPNDAVNAGIATDLGARATYDLQNLTIHSVMDEDFFKVVALHTGKLTFSMSTNGRVADLDIQVLDKFNPHVPPNVVATSAAAVDSNDTESATIPVVAGETYYLRVFAQTDQQPPFNVYNLSIVNMPIPAPFQISLAQGSDSGRVDSDAVTNMPNATIRLRVDELWLAGLAFSPSNGTVTLADDAPGYKVAVYRNGTQAGFATPVGGQPGAFSFTFPLSSPLSEGYNAVTARVFVVDPSDDPDTGGTSHVIGQGSESAPGIITLDTTPPPPPSAPDLLPSSDSGASNSDNVTRVNPPAFQGTGEANGIVRIFANGVLVGQGVVGSDATDGVMGNGLGAWEVTIEPLADGTYAITATVEDLAGNISAPSAAMSPALVLDTPEGGGMPQRPTLDLLDSYDTGRSDQDNNTRLSELVFRISAEPGTTVVIKDGNTVIDTFVMPPSDFTTRTLVLAEGPHPLSTESTDLAGNRSHQSEQLLVTVDVTNPVTPGAPDLIASSDTGGINVDNITTVTEPTFGGGGEPNTLVRFYARNVLGANPFVGQGIMTSIGTYQVSTEPLADGVYSITVTLEDLAGNISVVSPPLKITIANQTLNLPGATSLPAAGAVVVDLNAGTVTGYPGVPGGVIGIVGIPVVNLDVSGHALSVLGTVGDDTIVYTPNGAQSGSVMRNGVNQVFNFVNAAGAFSINPVSGNDTVMVNGTTSSDVVTVTVTTVSIVQVNSLKPVNVPIANTEKLGVASGQSTDAIYVTVYDTVNANVFIDAGQPSNVSHTQDELHIIDGVGNAMIKNLSAGPVPGSGSMTVDYSRTTGAQTRIDYVDVEKLRTFR